MGKIKTRQSKSQKVYHVEFMEEKLQSVMPEVHRQVKVYEEKLKAGKLEPAPKSHPLFGK